MKTELDKKLESLMKDSLNIIFEINEIERQLDREYQRTVEIVEIEKYLLRAKVATSDVQVDLHLASKRLAKLPF